MTRAGAAGPGLPGAGPAWRHWPGGRRQDWPGRSALMASPDGVGWPEEPAGPFFAAARDESRFRTAGLGWPRVLAGTKRGAPGTERGPAGSGPGPAAADHMAAAVPGAGAAVDGAATRVAADDGWGASEANDSGQGQVSREGRPGEPRARMRQALSAAVSRETDARSLSARDEAQGSGTVRTPGKPPSSASA